jgi:hypothetical protein
VWKLEVLSLFGLDGKSELDGHETRLAEQKPAHFGAQGRIVENDERLATFDDIPLSNADFLYHSPFQMLQNLVLAHRHKGPLRHHRSRDGCEISPRQEGSETDR